MLKKNFENGQIAHLQGCPLVSHVLYADDDILLFVNGEKQAQTKTPKILKTYEKWSSQVINKEKSTLFMSKHISSTIKRELHLLTRFSEGRFQVTYLGAPLNPGCMTSHRLKLLVQKVRNKVANQKARLLSQGGRLILTLHVLSCMVTHTLAVLPVPLMVIREKKYHPHHLYLGR